MKKKIALLMACVMAFGVAVGGTLAWLTDSTEEVKNTFTDSDINITLTEENKKYNETEDYLFKMVPGDTFAKDPKVTVEANSEACWLFVKVEKSANFDTYMTSAIADGWTALADDGDNNELTTVYWRKNDATTDGVPDGPYSVLAGDKVTVKTDVTKADMDAIDGVDDDGNPDTSEKYPTLSFTAYAIQQAHIADDTTKTDAKNAATAWAEINKPATP